MAAKHAKKSKKIYIIIPLIIILIVLLSYLFYNLYINMRDKKLSQNLQHEIDNNLVDNTINTQQSEIVNKVKELQTENEDVKAWIKIDDTNINYPVVQTADNDYYLYRNYKKKKRVIMALYLLIKIQR